MSASPEPIKKIMPAWEGRQLCSQLIDFEGKSSDRYYHEINSSSRAKSNNSLHRGISSIPIFNHFNRVFSPNPVI